MKIITKISIIIIVLHYSLSISSQNHKKGIFSSPLNIPVKLAGNFGEIRPTHFHGGLDIKTESMEGKVVLAAADGYVSKIKISPGGYGNVLYIRHGNQYMTVYGHLKSFRDDMGKYVLAKQYENQSYSVELELSETQFPVHKCDTVAFSGNSGTSGGPHLHFEIRDINSEITYNPLLFGFDIKDNLPPIIEAIEIIPYGKHSTVHGQPKKKIIYAKGKGGRYSLFSDKPVDVSGDIGFGILSFDKLNGESNKCGVFSIELLVDSILVYQYVSDHLVINDTRYVLSHIDFEEKMLHKKSFQKSYLDPYNLLDLYHNVKNRGIIHFADDSIHQLGYIVKDSYGNTSYLSFRIKSHNIDTSLETLPVKSCTQIIPYDSPYTFNSDGISIVFPDKALYDTLFFDFSKSPKLNKSFSPVFNIHNRFTPLHKAITITIKADSTSYRYYDKLLVALVENGKKGNSFKSVGGTFSNGTVVASTKEFGKYTLVADTIPPTIKAVNISKGKKMSAIKTLKFIVSDDLSGIGLYNGYIDGNWVLFRYDEKRKLLYYEFDDNRIEKNREHKILLKISDNKNNESFFETNFFW
jgi:hypothetical protein